MSQPYKQTKQRTGWLGNLLRFAFLCLAVLAAARLLSTTQSPSSQDTTFVPTSTLSIETSTATLLVFNEESITTLPMQGNSERLSVADFRAKFKDHSLPTEGVNVANGSPTIFHFPDQASSGTLGEFVSPGGQFSAHMEAPAKDGASIIRLSRKQGEVQFLPLRSDRGQPIVDATLKGWFDEHHLAVIGRVSSTESIVSVQTSGAVVSLARLPENVLWTQMRAGSVWYVVASPGEGIESNPIGPSRLYRVGLGSISSGDQAPVLVEDPQVIQSVVPLNDLFAITLDTGQSFIRLDGRRIELDKRRPLLWLPDRRLIVRDGFELAVFDPATSASRKLGTVPEGSTSIFLLPY